MRHSFLELVSVIVTMPDPHSFKRYYIETQLSRHVDEGTFPTPEQFDKWVRVADGFLEKIAERLQVLAKEYQEFVDKD